MRSNQLSYLAIFQLRCKDKPNFYSCKTFFEKIYVLPKIYPARHLPSITANPPLHVSTELHIAHSQPHSRHRPADGHLDRGTHRRPPRLLRLVHAPATCRLHGLHGRLCRRDRRRLRGTPALRPEDSLPAAVDTVSEHHAVVRRRHISQRRGCRSRTAAHKVVRRNGGGHTLAHRTGSTSYSTTTR